MTNTIEAAKFSAIATLVTNSFYREPNGSYRVFEDDLYIFAKLGDVEIAVNFRSNFGAPKAFVVEVSWPSLGACDQAKVQAFAADLNMVLAVQALINAIVNSDLGN